MNPRLRLTVTGHVDVPASFGRRVLNLGTVQAGSTTKRTEKLVAQNPQKTRFENVRSSAPEQVSAKLIEQDGKPAVEITVRAPEKAGRINAIVSAETNLEKTRVVRMRVVGRVVAR